MKNRAEQEPAVKLLHVRIQNVAVNLLKITAVTKTRVKKTGVTTRVTKNSCNHNKSQNTGVTTTRDTKHSCNHNVHKNTAVTTTRVTKHSCNHKGHKTQL